MIKISILIAPHNETDIHNKKAHAEMNIISHLLQQNIKGSWYLGISKLTCFDCTNDIIIINTTGKITILTRGEHNVNYSDRH